MMQGLKATLLRHRGWAAAWLAVALMMRALIPSGMMLTEGPRVLSLSICSDSRGRTAIYRLALPTRATGHDTKAHDAGTAKGICAFSILSHALLDNADPHPQVPIRQLVPAPDPLTRSAGALGRVLRNRPPVRGPPILT